MLQLKYAMRDIKHNKRFYIVQIILVLVTYLLIGWCISKYTSLCEMRDTAADMISIKNTYIIRDETEMDVFIDKVTRPESVPRLFELYRLIDQTEHYTVYIYGTLSLPAHGDIDIVGMDRHAMELFNVSGEKNVFDRLTDNRHGYIPVLAGNEILRDYKVGDIIGNDYIIVGDINKNAFYLRPSWTPDIMELDSCLVYAISVTDKSGVYELNAAITGAHIITNNTDTLYKIAEYSDEQELYSLSFISLSDQITRIFEQELKGVRYSMIFIIMAILLGIACMASALLTFIDTHMREFAVHFMYGASLNDIVLRLTLQAGSIYLFSYLAVGLVYLNGTVLLCLFLISIILCAAVAVLPVIKLGNTGINQIIRRGE